MTSKSNIIVPWDFSEHSKLALHYALDEFEPGDIKVICVLEPPSPYVPGMEWGEEAEIKAHESCTQQFFDTVDIEKIKGTEFITVFGDPATEISSYANQRNARLIVISTHGRTGVQRLLMGSVAQKVASKSKCPILLLPNGWIEEHVAEIAERDKMKSN